MVGGVRNKDDERVVDDIRKCATELDLIEGVDFKFVCNAPLENILDLMKVVASTLHFYNSSPLAIDVWDTYHD